MKITKLIPIALSTLLGGYGLLLPDFHSNAKDQVSQVTVDAYNVHIRSGAGTDYPVIGEADFGSRYVVISQDHGWFEVSLPNGGTGWIASWLTTNVLQSASNSSNNPSSSSSSNTTDSDHIQTQTATAIEKQTNVRSGPSTSYDIIATIEPGTSYAVSQISGDWVQIRLPNERSGWVAKWVVTLGSENAKQIAMAEQKQATITGSDVRLRDNPSLDSHVIKTLQQGTIVQVIEQQAQWYKVQLDKSVGWVSSDFIQTQDQAQKTLPGTVSNQTQSSPSGTVTPLETGTHIRVGPGLNYSILGDADLKTSYPVVDKSGQWWKIKLQDGKTGWIASWVVKANQVNITSTHSNQTASIDQILRGKTIVLDPGHGGIDVGAIGSTTGLYEKDMTLATAKVLFNKLQETGAHVIMTRTDDTFISLEQRVVDAKQAHADAFVSIHENTNPDPNIAGTITYFYNPKGEDAKLADDIEQSIDGGIAHPEIGTQFGDYYVLRENPQLAVLVECAFLSNAADEQLADSPDFQEKIADGILKGLITYFNGKSQKSGQ
jgi:N-acetylmuramoyl-L-alanine amidase